MKPDEDIIRLICSLERYIGSECFNTKSYNGNTMIEGLDFRYPLTYTVTGADGEEYTHKTNYLNPNNTGITKKTVETMKYRFGANELYVGKAIVNLLSALEERYGIDFEELEKKYLKLK